MRIHLKRAKYFRSVMGNITLKLGTDAHAPDERGKGMKVDERGI